MELDTVKLADLLCRDCRIVLFCKEDSLIHELYRKGDKEYSCEPIRFSSRTFSLSMLVGVRKAIRNYQIRNVIFFGASELKTLYFSFLGFDLNVIVRHGTTKNKPKRGAFHRLVYSCVRRHVALSKHLLDNVKTIVPVKDGVDFRIITSSFDSAGIKQHKQVNEDSNALRLVHVGRVAPGKGQIEAVAACSELPKINVDFQLDFLGGCEDRRYFNQLKAAISQYGMESYVALHGHVDNVGAYMEKADIFLFPSYGEGMSNAMIEALHYGHVCLCYSNTVFPEFRDMGFHIVLAKDRDQADLSKKLVGIVRNFDEEKAKSKRNITLALKYFDRERERTDWLQILK